MSRDNTRNESEYFGLNWGSAADLLVKEELDTGDMLMIKYDCDQSLDMETFVRCYDHQLFRAEDYEYDDLAIVYRDIDDLYVLHNHNNTLRQSLYSRFLSQPNFKELSFRKLTGHNPLIQKHLKQLSVECQLQKSQAKRMQLMNDFVRETGILNGEY